MSKVQASPFIDALQRRDSLTRLTDDAAAKGAASNDLKVLIEDVIELQPILTGCKEGTDKEKDKEKEKDSERVCRIDSHARAVPVLSTQAGHENGTLNDLRLAQGTLIF